MTSAPAKKPRRFFKRFATACAAMLAVCFLSFSVAAVALGSYSAAWEYISSNVSAILKWGCNKDVDGITIIKSDYTKKYDTIEELLVAENLDILYPAALPEGVKIYRVRIIAYDDGKQKISFIFNNDTYTFQIKNHYSVDLKNTEPFYTYTVDETVFYITIINDGTYQAIAQQNNYEYAVDCSDYNNLIYILSNMKGLSK